MQGAWSPSEVLIIVGGGLLFCCIGALAVAYCWCARPRRAVQPQPLSPKDEAHRRGRGRERRREPRGPPLKQRVPPRAPTMAALRGGGPSAPPSAPYLDGPQQRPPPPAARLGDLAARLSPSGRWARDARYEKAVVLMDAPPAGFRGRDERKRGAVKGAGAAEMVVEELA